MSHTFTDESGSIYDVDVIIELTKDFPQITVPLVELESNLDEDCWNYSDDGRETSDKPNFSPRFVAENWKTDKASQYHYAKAVLSDLAFPLIVTRKDNLVIDGMHRLLKAHLVEAQNLKVIYLDKVPDEARVK